MTVLSMRATLRPGSDTRPLPHHLHRFPRNPGDVHCFPRIPGEAMHITRLDAAVAGRLLAGTTELRPGNDLDAIGG